MKNRYVFTEKCTLARQRGAIGVLGALVLAMGVLFMALSVDSGRLYLEQQRLQKIADTAALDASRALCGAAAANLTAVSAAAQASALRNGYGGNVSTEAGAVQVGNTSPNAAGLRQFTGAALESATAARVTARNTVLRSLVAGGWWGGTTTLSATAVASDEAIAGFSAGSFLARLELPPDSGILNPLLNPLLRGVLGTGLNLDLVSYKGLAAADVTLLHLIEAQGSVGTVNELLALNMDVADFLALTAEALSNQGDATAAATLNSIAVSVTRPIALTLGDLLKVTTEDPDAALDAKVNVMDLLMGSAQVANGIHAVTIPMVGVAIPGVVLAGVTLWLIEPPQIAIGPAGKDADGNWKTQVETAQVRLALTLTLSPVNLGLAAVSLGPLSIAIDVAKTKAHLESIDCPVFRMPDGRATVGVQPGIAGLALGQLDGAGNVTGPANIARVTLLGIPVGVRASAATAVASPAPVSLEFDGPFPSELQQVGTEPGPAVAGALGDLVGNLHLTLQVPVVGPLLNALLQPLLSALRALVGNVVGPIIGALGDALLTPLLSALGVTLGGADVQVFTLEGEQPRLRI